MNENALVSIIAPCYNGEISVTLFLESVLNQDYPTIELIIINDGSTDNTEKIIKGYKTIFDRRGYELKYLYQENGGQASAINKGLKIFSGDYVMWVDSDDILVRNNVSKKVEYLQAHPECGFVLSQEASVNSSNIEKIIKITKRQHNTQDNIFSDMIDGKNMVFGPGTILVRKSAMLQSFPDFTIFESREGQNWQLMLPLCYMHKCGYIDEPLLKCVNYPESHSHRKRTPEELFNRYDGIAELIINTIDRVPSMPEREKRKWKNYVRNKYLRTNLYLAYDLKDKERICLYRDRLIANHGYSLKCFKIIRTMMKRLRK